MNEEYMKEFHPELAEYYQKGDCCTWIVELRKKVSEKDKEIERLNNIINELEKELKEYFNRIGENKKYVDTFYSQAIYNDIEHILNKLKNIKESANNEG